MWVWTHLTKYLLNVVALTSAEDRPQGPSFGQDVSRLSVPFKEREKLQKVTLRVSCGALGKAALTG